MPLEIKNEYKNLKEEAKIPIWQFVGIVLIACVFAYFIFDNKKDKKNELAYINSPLVEDVYRYKTESNNYSTFIVSEIMSDSIYLIPNKFEFTEMKGIEEIEVDSNYADYYYSYAKAEIISMYEDGTIYDVVRE